MKPLPRIAASLLVFLATLAAGLFLAAIALRQGLLHHPYSPELSPWLDRGLLLLALVVPLLLTAWCYRALGKR